MFHSISSWTEVLAGGLDDVDSEKLNLKYEEYENLMGYKQECSKIAVDYGKALSSLLIGTSAQYAATTPGLTTKNSEFCLHAAILVDIGDKTYILDLDFGREVRGLVDGEEWTAAAGFKKANRKIELLYDGRSKGVFETVGSINTATGKVAIYQEVGIPAASWAARENAFTVVLQSARKGGLEKGQAGGKFDKPSRGVSFRVAIATATIVTFTANKIGVKWWNKDLIPRGYSKISLNTTAAGLKELKTNLITHGYWGHKKGELEALLTEIGHYYGIKDIRFG